MMLIMLVAGWLGTFLWISQKQKDAEILLLKIQQIDRLNTAASRHIGKFAFIGYHKSATYLPGINTDIKNYNSAQDSIKFIVDDRAFGRLFSKYNGAEALNRIRQENAALIEKSEYLEKYIQSHASDLYTSYSYYDEYTYEHPVKYKLIDKKDILRIAESQRKYLVSPTAVRGVIALNMLDSLKGTVPANTLDFAYLSRQREEFNTIYRFHKDLGVNYDTGLIPAIFEQTEDFEMLYQHEYEKIKKKTVKHLSDFQYILISSFAIIISIALITAFFLSKYLSSDLTNIHLRMKNYMDYDLTNSSSLRRRSLQAKTIEFQKLDAGIDKLERTTRKHIRDLKNKQALLQKENEAVELADKSKSSFLATVSHEIRTPINGILGMASLLTETKLNAEQSEYVEAIYDGGKLVLGTVNNILDYTKLESGKVELHETEFDLHAEIENIIEQFYTPAREKNLDINYSIAQQVPKIVLADQGRLHQILTNLMRNAIKFTNKGSVYIKVRCAPNKSPEGKDPVGVEITISDTGTGMDKMTLHNIFSLSQYNQKASLNGVKRKGLSLAISKQLATLMKGDLSAESTLGRGSSFSLSLEVAEKEDINTGQDTALVDMLRGKKVLLVNFGKENYAAVSTHLSALNMTTLEVGADVASFAGSEAARPDVLIYDNERKSSASVEMVNYIRKTSPDTLFITLYGDKNLPPAIASENTTLKLCKPLIYRKLVQRMHQHFKEKSNRIEPAATLLPQQLFAYEYPINILVAEDDLINQKLILRFLTKLGYTPNLANNGKEAIDLVDLYDVDLILMDMQMPVMDGIEATRQIRNKFKQRHVIAALTANVSESDRRACFEAGMDAFISKPLSLDSIPQLIRKHFTSSICCGNKREV